MTLCTLLLAYFGLVCNPNAPVGIQVWPDGIVQVWVDTGQNDEWLDRAEYPQAPLTMLWPSGQPHYVLAVQTPCQAYVIDTGDFPGSRRCGGLQEDDPQVSLWLTLADTYRID